MLNIERNNLIVKLVNEKNSVSVAELSQILEVSEVTVRKVLNDLDHQGLIRRTRGGAISIHEPIIEVEEREKEKANIKEKKLIANAAYQLIHDSDTVFLDAGSTTLEIAKLIKAGAKRNITVVTNALNIANELITSYDIEVIMVGGSVRHKIMSCVGGFTESIVSNLNFDITFIGSNSVSLTTGVTTPNMLEAQVKRCVLKQARKKILVCDASKFGLTTMSKICALENLDTIITDSSLKKDMQEKMLQAGINLVVAQ